MATPIRRRTRARELAVQFLYQLDLRGEEVLADLDTFLTDESKDQEVRDFARALVVGTQKHRDDYDRRLRAVTRNWDLKRMAVVDRNVLRMAIYEMSECADIPAKVTINEAIELAKRFSTQNSGAFVNGILDRIRLDLVQEGRLADATGARANAAPPVRSEE
ncbi:MAG: transcription antitermination factor NusB [Planctomycetes bacterium]|nr:transcription antitermination factor NusB [Planctomycetota bacterium]